ncbi:unnamed protein product [Rotaria sordida]|uniref:F-box domain-containing protein n=1 Tax=Rotaria sordida TaxID=392033 RepID=A0A815PK74_9BILA|nr:unnamed protein product [Rotaria sordida]CAF1449985.1 unnamed protein product [Rotaria sordida]
MSKDTEYLLDDDDSFSRLSIEPLYHNVTCLLDLSDKILLRICRYMSPAYVLYSFYTPEMPNMRLHRLIVNYYTKIKLGQMTYNEYKYLISLFSCSNYPLRPESLILSNEHVTCVTQRYFNYMYTDVIRSVFVNLKYLTLIDCSSFDLDDIVALYMNDLIQLEYLHITVRKLAEHNIIVCLEPWDTSIGRLLFDGLLSTVHTVNIELPNGLLLHKLLRPHQTLRHVQIVLQTIDDLYILLSGLVPNVETMSVELRQARLLTCLRPQCTSSCPRLTEFTLLEPRIGLIIDDIKCIFGYMPALHKLTLSIRDTPDPIFCHGPKFESILNEYFPYLCQFDYTMTHRIMTKTFIKDFIQWPMNVVFYANESSQWVHIFSVPWPSNKNDKRRLPIINSGCNTSVLPSVKRDEHMDHVKITMKNDLYQLKTRFYRAYQLTTCLTIDIVLPQRISKLILTEQTPIGLMNSIVQPNIRHLIVQRRLIDEKEISILAHQFPNVKYLQLLFPLDRTLFVRCFQTLFSDYGTIYYKRSRYWCYLVNFCTTFDVIQLNQIINDSDLHRWLIENTDLKLVIH